MKVMVTLILNTTKRVKPHKDNNVNITYFTVVIPLLINSITVSLQKFHIPLSYQTLRAVRLISVDALYRSAHWKGR
jgi:uncharacterized membrane protein YGL010W